MANQITLNNSMFRSLPKIDPEDTISFEDLIKIGVSTLTNTDEDTFWWKTAKFEQRFKHEQAKKGSRFVDGNNGDSWRVIVEDTKHNRLIVQNLTQDFLRIVIWN